MNTNQHKLNVYSIDDDPFENEWIASGFKKYIAEENIQLSLFANPHEFLKTLTKTKGEKSLFLVDLQFAEDGLNGLDILRAIRKSNVHSFVIIRTNQSDISYLAEALEHTADVICIKSEDDELLWDAIKSGILALATPSYRLPVPDYIYMNHFLNAWLERVPKILDSAVTNIHINGPSGSGKEVYVDILQSQLPVGVPFVRVNCAAIAESVMESELFGHSKGSFTGASKDRKGYFSLADTGWLFLDEVSCLSLNMQAALLRALECGAFYPVGSSHEEKVRVKIVSATNEDLNSLVESGKFRLDLKQRLCEMTIQTPKVKDIGDELPQYIRHLCARLNGGPYQITDSLVNILKNMDWSEGQNRELRNCLRSMTEKHHNRCLTPASLPKNFIPKIQTSPPSKSSGSKFNFEEDINALLVKNLEEMFRTDPKLSIRKIAARLDISRSTLMRRLHSAKAQGLIKQELLQKVPASL